MERDTLEWIGRTIRNERLAQMAYRLQRYMGAIREMKDLAEGSCEDRSQDAAFLAMQLMAEHGENIARDVNTAVRQIADAVDGALAEPEAPGEEPEAGGEDKRRICGLLLPALRATRGLSGLAKLDYSADDETVTAVFANGFSKSVNVACDSGTAMIRGILEGLR